MAHASEPSLWVPEHNGHARAECRANAKVLISELEFARMNEQINRQEKQSCRLAIDRWPHRFKPVRDAVKTLGMTDEEVAAGL